MGVDRDYEALMRELLAGVAGGWSYGNVIVLLMTKGVDETDLALWLTKFAGGLSLERDSELIEQIKLLGKMTPGKLAAEAFLVAAKFDRSYGEDSELVIYDAWLDKGNEFFALGRYEDAIVNYNRAIEIQSDINGRDRVWYNKGIALDNLGRYEEALISFDRAIEIKPDKGKAWYSRGIALGHLELCEEAIFSYNRAIEIKTDDDRAWSNRGNELANLRRYAEAIDSYDRAIKIKTDHHDTWCNRGFALRYLERYKEAIDCYDRAIEIKPDDHDAWTSRGATLVSLGQYADAIASYERVIEIKPRDHNAWYNLGVAMENLDQYQKAIANYDLAIKIKPDDYQSWCNRGTMLLNLNQYDEAITSFEHAIKFKTDSHQAWSGRAIPFGILKGYQEKIDAYYQAFKYIHIDTHCEGWGYLQHEIGRAHYQEGKNQFLNHRKIPQIYYSQALTAYNNALQTLTRPKFPEPRLETLIDLAQVYLAQHNPTAAHASKLEALDIFRYLLNAQPTFEAKKRLQLKYTSLRQLDVELFIATGDNIRALEAAELDKNERLTLLLSGLEEQTISPSYADMRQLLTSETTGIIYWHLSPDNLTTFILTATEPQPLVWNIDNRAQQAQQLKEWIKTWDTQYDDYRNHKSSKAQPSQNSEPTTNDKADVPWRKNLTANLMQLKQILDIDNICKQLPANLTNLILIPHGNLHRFPLHVLFLTAQKSQIRGCTYLPSIQIGLNLRDRSSQSYTPLLSVADPATEQAPMPFAQLESAIIRHLLQPHTSIDPQSANLATVETALNSLHASFHFTGHAAHNSRKPEDSALALTDAPLTAKRIAQLNLSSYNLITLAACETAITGRTSITTEYVGLTSAFLQAGAANILSTLWQVDEISNAWFTIYFHQQLLAGCSPAIALTITQIWLKTVTWQHLADWLIELKQIPNLKIGIIDKLQANITNTLEDGGTIGLDRPSKYSDPYYWAAFTLTGRG